MNQSLVIAVDQGGQSSRVAIYSITGSQLYCCSVPCKTERRRLDNIEYIEQSPKEILEGIKQCLEKIPTLLGDDNKNIIAAGFAGQGSSLLCWNNLTGEALSPVLSWQDVRGEAYLKAVSLNHTQAQKISGLRISPHYGATKIRWCLENNAQVIAARKNNLLSIGPIVSYVLWHLCGVNAVDPGHAQRTLLWNLHTNTWDEKLLKVFGIPRDVLPDCHFHNGHFGELALGLNKIPLVTSARDQGASLFAQGIPDKNTCYINIGTGAFIQRVSEKLQAPEGLLVSPLWLPKVDVVPNAPPEIELTSPTCYAAELTDDNKSPQALYAWEATVNGAASAISYLEQETGLTISPEQISQSLGLSPVHDCYFLNAVGGTGAPFWRTDLHSFFSENLSAEEKILAWLESIIFQITLNMRLMDALGKPKKIRVSGGISNADAVCQKLADLLEISVYRSENSDATLQGIAFMAAGFPDVWQAAEAGEIFEPSPNPTLLKAYNLWHNALTEWLST